jgi:2-methylcitrate dehydratase PrpD
MQSAMSKLRMTMSATLSQTLGRLIAETSLGTIPQTVVERAKVSLLHNLCVGLIGRPREQVAHRMAAQFWSLPAEATLLHSGGKASAEGAAFANTALLNARSQDDTHPASTSHPGSPTTGAALALAEAGGASGAACLTAIVLGYEVLCRIGRDFDHLITARGFRAASVLAGFGATAASASLLRLSAEQAGHALGLAANLSGGLAQVWLEGSAEAPFQLAFAARNGITAARAAAFGATAAASAFEGPSGLFRAFAGTSEPPVQALAETGQWQLEEVTLKPYPVCAILQGPVSALLGLRTRHDVAPSDLDRITVTLNPAEAAYPGVDHAGPFASAIATKMSAQFSLALAFQAGRVTLDGLDRVDDGDVLALVPRVEVLPDPAMPQRLCRVQLHLHNGQSLKAIIATPVGQPGFEELTQFARALAPEMGAKPAAIDRLIAAVAGLDRAPDVSELLAAAVACQPVNR